MSGISQETFDERTRRIVELTRQGLTVPVIAARVGISERSVTRHRVRAGVARPAVPPISDDELRRAKLMLDDGVTIAEAARTLGRGHTPLARYFREYVLPPAEAGKFARLGREMARLEREAGVR